nr:hypothetical protein [Echinimonas agarilytica]
MILVNTPGSWAHVYWPLLHSAWHGCTPTDLIFPFFLFILGSAMHFSRKKLERLTTPQALMRCVKRGTVIVAIGVALNVYNFLLLDLDHLRVMGVLQRIGLCFIAAGILVQLLPFKGLYAVSVVILIGYPMVLIQGSWLPWGLEGNLVRHVDMAILGEKHMWQMNGVTFEPEGLLSTMPAIVNVLIGYEATRRLSQMKSHFQGIRFLITAAVICLLLGYAVSVLVPINKSLWTSSYVLVSSAMALAILALLIGLVDVGRSKRFAFVWQVYGMNPLFAYIMSWLLATSLWAISVQSNAGAVDLYTFLWQQLAGFMSLKAASLLFAAIQVSLFWCLCLWLYRRQIIIKI